METKVNEALARMIDVFGDKAKNIPEYEIFTAHRGSVGGRDKVTLIPLQHKVFYHFNVDEVLASEKVEDTMNLQKLYSQQRIEIYAYLLKKELRALVEDD